MKFKSGPPTVDPITLLHRAQSSKHLVPIIRRNPDKRSANGEPTWEECAVPAFDLAGWFPQFIEQFKRDSYFGINGMFAACGRVSGRPRRSRYFRDAFDTSRGSHRIHALTACFADIDCHKLEPARSVGSVVGELIDFENKGELPPISMLLLSGRGVWAFWFLRDPEHDGPVVSWRENIQLWNLIQERINAQLRHLGADSNAKDVARVARIPGTLNPKSGEYVRWNLVLDSEGHPILHRLHDLARDFGVSLSDGMSRRLVPDADPAKRMAGQRGQVGRWWKCYRMLFELTNLRQRHPVGCRHATAYIYSGSLAAVVRGAARIQRDNPSNLPAEWKPFADMIEADIIEDARLFALRYCEQPANDPVSVEAVEATARKAVHRPLDSMKNATVSDYCRITATESQQLAALGFDFPPMASDDGQRIEETESVRRKDQSKARRDFIAQKTGELRRVPTASELHDFLAPVGLDASDATLQKDLRELGIINPRSKTAREQRRRVGLFDRL